MERLADAWMIGGDDPAALSGTGRFEGGAVVALRGDSPDDLQQDCLRRLGRRPGSWRDAVLAAAADPLPLSTTEIKLLSFCDMTPILFMPCRVLSS